MKFEEKTTTKVPSSIVDVLLEALPGRDESHEHARQRLVSCAVELDDAIIYYGHFSSGELTFLAQKISYEIGQASSLSSVGLLTEGKSSNLVFKAETIDGFRFISKLIPHENSHDLFAEVVSLIRMQSLRSVQLATARLIGLGSCCLDLKPYYVVTQSFLNGVSMGSLLDKLVETPPLSEERNAIMKEACKAFECFGYVLGGFHNEDFDKTSCFSKSRFIEILTNDFEKFLGKVASLANTGISANVLESFIKDQMRNLPSLDISCGYMFLDPHFGNVYWDRANGKNGSILLIDTGTCFYSFCNENQGCGMPDFDVFLITEMFFWLRREKYHYAKGRLFSGKEIDLIRAAFIQGYKQQRNYHITDKQVVFFTLVQVAWYMNWFLSQKFFDFSLIDIQKEEKKDGYQCIII